jgi:hypothetical protein
VLVQVRALEFEVICTRFLICQQATWRGSRLWFCTLSGLILSERLAIDFARLGIPAILAISHAHCLIRRTGPRFTIPRKQARG